MGLRQIKILFAVVPALYMALVTFNNIADYPTNLGFVKAVFSMTDVFTGQANRWRAIEEDVLHQVAYLFILAVELTVAVFLAVGAFRMFKARSGEVGKFHHAGKLVSTGLAIGVVLWFGIFIGIGGEWFLMWQSEKWNAQATAFSLSAVFLLFLNLQLRHDH
jgi:predicted small integral membrane protein